MGKRSEHAEWISEIAGIDANALLRSPNNLNGNVALSSFCVAKRMSWASNRETTRPEDIAYCLLGIFDVNMPLFYGEGDRAFLRLQEEIIRRTDDDSILAWGREPEMGHPLGLVPHHVELEMAEGYNERDLLASSPKDFIHCANLKYTSGPNSPFTLTNVGLQIELPLVPVYEPDDRVTSQPDDHVISRSSNAWIGLLSCSSDTSEEFLGIPLVPAANDHYGLRIQKMSRVDISKETTHVNTLVLGPRAAVMSYPGTIIISRYGRDDSTNEYYYGHEQIIINESRELRKIGY